MSKNPGVRSYFRTTGRLRGEYAKLLGNLRGTVRISEWDGRVSNDAIINSLLLWASRQEPEELARVLEPHIEHFEAAWDAEIDGRKKDAD